MQERKNSEAGNEKEVDYGRKSGQDNTSENVIENRPEKRVKNKGGGCHDYRSGQQLNR